MTFTEQFTGAAGSLPTGWIDNLDTKVRCDGAGSARMTASAANGARIIYTAGGFTRQIRVRGIVRGLSAGVSFGFVGAYVSAAGVQTGYEFGADGANVYLVVKVGGSNLSVDQPAHVVVDGDEVRLDVVDVAGVQTLIGFVNGVEILRRADSNITTGVCPSVFLSASTAPSFDSITADDLSAPPAATSYTLVGPTPADGVVGAASGNFTVTPNGDATGIVITPHSTGAGTFSPATITLAGTAAATFTYTPTSATGSPHAISTTNSGTLSNPAAVNYTVDTVVLGSPDDPSWWFTSNWRLNGSTYAETNSPTAYFKTKFSGASVGLSVDVSMLVAAGATAGQYPVIQWSIDGGALVRYQLLSTDTTKSLATGLAAGVHTLEVEFVAATIDSLDRWNTPVMVLRVTALVLAAGGALSAPDIFADEAWYFGDSLSEAAQILGGADQNADTQDTSQSIPRLVGRALNCEINNRSFAGGGIITAPTDFAPGVHVPNVQNSWNLHSLGHSILVGGQFVRPPKYIIMNLGFNDNTMGQTAANIQAAVQGLITAWRAAAPNAGIAIFIPEDGSYRTALTAAVAASGDANTTIVDPGENFNIPEFRNAGANTGHLSVRGHAHAAAIYAAECIRKFAALSGTGGSGRVPQIGSPFIHAVD